MLLRYDPDDRSERQKLSELLEEYGIYFECDLFDHAHVVINTTKLSESRKSTGRPRKIDDSVRNQAKRMKEEGMTIRQIASELSISVGTAYKFTKGL